MLSPEYYEGCADDIIELYEQLEDDIISDVVRRIVKTGKVTETAKHQIEQLQESGILYDDILKTIAKNTNATSQHVKALFEDAGVETVKIDNEVYRENGLTPVDIRQSPAMRQTLEAGYRKTLGNMKNLTMTTANTSQTAYINACNQAYMQVSSGAFSYQEAIKNAVKNVAGNGATVLYPSGHTERIDVAVSRAVLTGVGQTCREIGIMNAEECGCDLMEISAHSGARPDHAKWQGQLVSLSGKNAGRTISGKKVLTLRQIGYGQGDGFGGWNCRHDWYPFFEDYSTPNYSKKELQRLDEKSIQYNGKMYNEYEASQIQRRYEREIRSAKREQSAFKVAVSETDDPELKQVMQDSLNYANSLVKDKQAKMRDFIKQTGQDRDYFREQNYPKENDQRDLTSDKNDVILDKKQVIDRAGKYASDLREVIRRFGRYKKGYGQQISKYIIEQINYDNFPKVVSAKEFKKLAKNNDVIYRGLSSSKLLTATEAANRFKYGDFFVGTGDFGNGTYGAYDKSIADTYAELAGKTSKSGRDASNEYSVLEMIMAEDAKIGDYQTIYKEWFDAKIPSSLQMNKFQDWQFIVGDIGTYAALKGYDAIKTNGARGRDYIVILNRGKVIVKK